MAEQQARHLPSQNGPYTFSPGNKPTILVQIMENLEYYQRKFSIHLLGNYQIFES